MWAEQNVFENAIPISPIFFKPFMNPFGFKEAVALLYAKYHYPWGKLYFA